LNGKKLKALIKISEKIIIISLMIFAFTSTVKAMNTMELKTNEGIVVGDTFDVDLYLTVTDNIKGWECKILFSDNIQPVRAVAGDFFTGFDEFFMKNITETSVVVYSLIIGMGNVSTSGVLAVITFTAIDVGPAFLNIDGEGVCNETMYLPLSIVNETFNIWEAPVDIPDSEPDIPNSVPDAPNNAPINENRSEITRKTMDLAGNIVTIILVFIIIFALLKVWSRRNK